MNEEKHAGGAPTKYDSKYIQEMLDYFDIDKTYTVEVKVPTKNGSVINEITKANAMPQFSVFARKIGCCVQTLLNWCEKEPEFLEAYNTCKAIQKEFIIENGMAGLYHPNFTIFVAKNVTDMRDKQEIDHTSGGEPMKPIVSWSE